MRSGITRRWLRGSLLITVLLVLLVEVMFLYSATRSYYNGVQQTMYRRFSSITGQLKMYTGETSQKTAASRSVALRRMVEQFSDKDKYEFMLLDSYGGVIASSSGTDAEGIVTRTDFEQAQDAVDGQGIAIYRTQSGEMVMAACCLVPYAAEDVAAMRLVTSLTLVEEQLKRTVVVALIMGAAVLAFTIMSGLYFVRSIVVPLGQVERTAAGIARGELDVRLPVTGDERDEVRMHLARRYLWASYDCMDYSGGVMLIHPALAEPQSVMRGKRRAGGLLMTPTGSARCTDILPEEIPLQQEMERAIAGALRDGQRAEDVATMLRLLCKQGAPLDALEDVLQTALIIYVSDAMRAALSDLYFQTPKWVISAGSETLQ